MKRAVTTPPLRVAIVGGGFTGVAFVVHLIRASDRALTVTMVEPSAELGRGIAYGTDDPAHRINVPSDRMGLFEADPTEATRWMFNHGVLPDARSTDEQDHHYVSRRDYGQFVSDVLQRTLAEGEGRVRFVHRRAPARAVDRVPGGWRVALDGGEPVQADVVALCFGHAAPHLPCPVDDASRCHPKFVPNPWAQDALRPISQSDSVLIVGTGLTMADVVVSLRERGHRGPITAVSRRGLLSLPHGKFLSGLDVLDGALPPTTALGLLRLARRRWREWGAELGWQPVADAVRFKLPDLWGALPPAEKARALKRLLPFWEIHRFRVAPQIHAAVERDRAAGNLTITRGALVGLSRAQNRFDAAIRRPDGTPASIAADAVVLCTGPSKDLRSNPLVSSLLGNDLARLDDAGIGIAVDRTSHVLRPDGAAWPTLFAFGPITRGTFGEMTGAPDIAKHLERTVPHIVTARSR